MHKTVTLSTTVSKWVVGNDVWKYMVYGSVVTWQAFFSYVVLLQNLRLGIIIVIIIIIIVIIIIITDCNWVVTRWQ